MLVDTVKRLDGWRNLLAGLSRRSDKTEKTDWDGYEILDDTTLSNLYDGEGLTSKIINRIPDDMTRNGWEIKNDDENFIDKEMTRLKATQNLNTALKYARLYRGSVLVMVPKTGNLESPLTQESSSKEIKQLRVYSAARIDMISTSIVDDPKSPYFEDVEFFTIRKRNGTPMKVHRSRCLVFKGELTSDIQELDLKYRYWGFSTIQKIWDRLRNYSGIEKGVSNLMLEFSIGKFKLSNLAQILSSGEEGMTQAYNRMEIINASKSIINAVMLGENEDYTTEDRSLAGVADVIDRGMMNLSSVCGIPVTLLFGRSPGGMNATGESDLRNYYDDVSSRQEIVLLPELQTLVNQIASYVYPEERETDEGELIEEYSVDFNSLWEPTEKEQAEIDKINAETDQMNIANQIISPIEARSHRFPELEQDADLPAPPDADEE